MPRLIITADDLGVNAQRSHGIFLCAESGAVTAASLWPNGSHSDTAARHARERGFPVGLHLNLVEEYPLSKPGDVASLVDLTGRFHPVQRLFTLLDEGQVKPEHLEREIRAQLAWALDHGLALTHVSGNWDAHVHPAVAMALIPAMERFGLRFVRIPCEEPLPPFGFEVPEEQLAAARAVNAMAKGARKLFEGAGIASTAH
ncbi:MAG: ChbG/HpnK family deacetylase, partial [Patescibacteria group bacterium]